MKFHPIIDNNKTYDLYYDHDGLSWDLWYVCPSVGLRFAVVSCDGPLASFCFHFFVAHWLGSALLRLLPTST